MRFDDSRTTPASTTISRAIKFTTQSNKIPTRSRTSKLTDPSKRRECSNHPNPSVDLKAIGSGGDSCSWPYPQYTQMIDSEPLKSPPLQCLQRKWLSDVPIPAMASFSVGGGGIEGSLGLKDSSKASLLSKIWTWSIRFSDTWYLAIVIETGILVASQASAMTIGFDTSEID